MIPLFAILVSVPSPYVKIIPISWPEPPAPTVLPWPNLIILSVIVVVVELTVAVVPLIVKFPETVISLPKSTSPLESVVTTLLGWVVPKVVISL